MLFTHFLSLCHVIGIVLCMLVCTCKAMLLVTGTVGVQYAKRTEVVHDIPASFTPLSSRSSKVAYPPLSTTQQFGLHICSMYIVIVNTDYPSESSVISTITYVVHMCVGMCTCIYVYSFSV